MIDADGSQPRFALNEIIAKMQMRCSREAGFRTYQSAII
jgi:hypothetical protein